MRETSAVDRFAVAPGATIRDVLARIERGGEGLALVLDEERRLLGVITDGDVRRAMLANLPFTTPAIELLQQKAVRGAPFTLPVDTARVELLRVMNERGLRHIPLVDGAGQVVDVALMSQLAREAELPLRAVVMAGGLGVRLRPLTEDLPKPMLPVGDRPVMEHIIEQLREVGIRKVSVTTHYKPEKIVEHFGTGDRFGVDISYVREDQPLGTAGALGLLRDLGEPLLVMNADILTDIDFRVMLAYHRENQADLTVAVRRYEVAVPYGVVESDGARMTRLVEKPSIGFFINAGIYLVEPRVLEHIPAGERHDMTDLIQRLLDAGRPVASFPVHEYWIDIGRPDDYQQAQADLLAGRRRA